MLDRRPLLILAVVLAAVGVWPGAVSQPSRAAEQLESAPAIAIVVGPRSPLHSVSLNALRLAYLGEFTRVTEVAALGGSYQPTEDAARGDSLILIGFATCEDAFLRRLLDRSFLQFRRYWARRVLSGENGTPPLRLRSIDEVVGALLTAPGALGYLPLDLARSLGDSGVRILGVEGLTPDHPDYPLR